MRDKQRCQQCKTITSNIIRNGYRILKSGEKRISYICNPCNTTRFKKYYHENKSKVQGIIYKSTAKHRDKQNARIKLNYHVTKGHIKKPENCERCGAGGRIEGHHDDYSKALEVMWLCTRCHGDRHRELRPKNLGKKESVMYT